MRDKATAMAIQRLHPKARAPFTAFIEAAEEALDITILCPQDFRSFEQQDAIYAQGRTKPGEIVTKAKGGQSYHNYGLAMDLVPLLIKNGKRLMNWNYKFSLLVPFAAKLGINWGGGWGDDDHFELKLGYTWQKLLVLYKAGKFIPGTHFVEI